MPPKIFPLKNNLHPNGNWGVTTRERHDGLCEYVSRSARGKLIMLLVKKFGSRGLAKALGVSHAAVNKWLRSSNTHPSNINLQKNS